MNSSLRIKQHPIWIRVARAVLRRLEGVSGRHQDSFQKRAISTAKYLTSLSPLFVSKAISSFFCKIYPEIFSPIPCAICGSWDFVVSSAGYKPLEAALYRGSPMFPYFSRNIFPLIYRECENCGCARINPAPHEAWVNWSPEGNDQSTIEMADWMEDREYIDDKVRSISGHYEKMGLEAFKTGGGAVLDVSCGTGVGLECLRDRFGWKRAEGVEFDRAAVRMATVRRQLRITHGLITSAKLEGGFDLVIMDNALEHHWSPRDALQSVFSQLRPGGGLFIVVPNFHGMAVELFGLEYHNMNWGHWHYFTVFSLMKLLRECGLEPVRAYSWFCDPMVQKKLGCIPEGTETDLDAQALTSLKASDKVFRGDFIQILARRSF